MKSAVGGGKRQTPIPVLRFFILVLFGVVFARLAHGQGGPPLITDDPGTPGNRHWEINVAFTDTKFRYGTVYELPHLDLNYGYGDNLQLKLEGPLTIFNGPGENYASLGYTNWGVKWRFLEENKKRPAISTYPQIIFVANDELTRIGVLDPGTDVFLPIEVMKSFGDLLLDAETGVLFRQFTGTELSSGICAEYELTKHLALLGEIHDITSTAIVQDELVWNLGFKQDFSEHESLICSAGRGFGPSGVDNPSFLTYIGVQFRL
jgi:hypothetical protein